MLRLQAGEASVVLAPEIGGALVGWTVGPLPVLRRALPESIVHGGVRGLAGFPLVPFANRIAYGRFQWDGQAYQLARNFGDHSHTIHGVGWQSVWMVEQVSAEAATLRLDYRPRPERWPFPFEAELHFALTEDALTAALRVTNRHTAAAPAGLGLHPYFPRSMFSRLRFTAAGVWLNGADALPNRHESVPQDWDHRGGRQVGSVVLDNCFTGWDGVAELEGAQLSLRLEADATLRHLQVYTPEGQDFFCVEPASHMPDAINRPAHPMRVLAPGESLAARITWHVRRGGGDAGGA